MLELEAKNSGKVLVQGHRGAMGYAPENTLVSFAKGFEQGADLLELDIHLSSDGELIVMHDGDVSRTTDGQGHIKNMTLAEIKKLDAGVKFDARFRGERVPTLPEVFAWAQHRIPLAVEIKGDPLPQRGIQEKLLALIRQFNMLDQVIVISFHHLAVKFIKELEPRLATGILLTGQLADPVSAARAALADSVRPMWHYWTAEQIAEVHAAGLTASTWTVNDEATMGDVIAMGVDSIGCNYPDRLRAYVDRAGHGWHR